MNKNLGKFSQFEMRIDILYLLIYCDYFKFIHTRCLILVNWKCVFISPDVGKLWSLVVNSNVGEYENADKSWEIEMKCHKLHPRLPVLPLKNLENLYPVDISTSPSRALPSQTSRECILYLFANLLFIAGGRSGPGRWLSWELGCWLFIKHVHWYLSYNIRSIVATGLDRSDPQDKLWYSDKCDLYKPDLQKKR